MNKKKQINVKSLLRAVSISAVTVAFFIGIVGETRSNCQQMIRTIMTQFSDETTRGAILDFVDFTKLDERLKDTNTVTCEFMSADKKWRKARYIVSGRLADGRVSNAMFLVEDIDKEKSTRDAALDAAKTLNYRVSSFPTFI